MQKELRDQGHEDTGKLVNGLTKNVFRKSADVIRGEILSNVEYGQYVNDGVQNARYSPKILVPWVQRVLGISDEDEALSVAWAIKKTHEETGIPSPGSYNYTSNGFRTNWTERSIEMSSREFQEKIDSGLFKYFNALAQDAAREFLTAA